MAANTPKGHQEDHISHENGQGHQHDHTGYENGVGHQKFHVFDDSGPPTEGSPLPGESVKAIPVGHQENHTSHENGQGHQHDHTGYENGVGHQKFHVFDDSGPPMEGLFLSAEQTEQNEDDMVAEYEDDEDEDFI
jgi:hypothetical protein